MSKMQKIQMTYTCSQEWEEMQDVDCGKYCEQCNKIVHDFTHSTLEEIVAEKRRNPEICGSFLPEQVEPDLIPLKLPKQWYAAAAVLGFLFAGKSINAQNTQDSVKTEQHIPAQTTPASSLNEIKNANKLPECPAEHEIDYTKRKYRRRKRIYISARFPFLHIKRRRTTGFYRGNYKVKKKHSGTERAKF